MNTLSAPAKPLSPIALKVIAWCVTLLVSPLPDILCFELAGAVPPWLFWGKAALLVVLILPGWPVKPLRPLLPYFTILLALTSFMHLNSWLLASPAWRAWQEQHSYAVLVIVAQLLEIGVALLLIGVLFLLRRRRDRFFLVMGDLHARTEPIRDFPEKGEFHRPDRTPSRYPAGREHGNFLKKNSALSANSAVSFRSGLIRLFGQMKPGPLWQFGLIFTLVVILGQVFLFILPLAPAAETWRKLLPFLPLILLLAAANGFSEEISLRLAPISPLFEVVGRPHALWMAAVFFGLAHYIGGAPSGLLGVLLTTLLGWFFGKCMLDSKGFFWPWLFHAVQDILPFMFMFLSAFSRG